MVMERSLGAVHVDSVARISSVVSTASAQIAEFDMASDTGNARVKSL